MLLLTSIAFLILSMQQMCFWLAIKTWQYEKEQQQEIESVIFLESKPKTIVWREMKELVEDRLIVVFPAFSSVSFNSA